MASHGGNMYLEENKGQDERPPTIDVYTHNVHKYTRDSQSTKQTKNDTIGTVNCIGPHDPYD